MYVYTGISEERFTVLITFHIKLYYFWCRYVTTGIELAKKASADLGWGVGQGQGRGRGWTPPPGKFKFIKINFHINLPKIGLSPPSRQH